MKLRFWGWLLAACMLLPALAGAQAQPKVIKMATIAISNSPWHKALLKFKEVVEAAKIVFD